jgi:hypothetical protein
MFTKMKSLFMVLILAGFTAQYATAENFNQEDMAFAFGDSAVVASDFGQMDLLSSQEMMETEGQAFWFLPALGMGVRFAINGFTRHGLNTVISRGVSNRAILHTLRNPRAGSMSYISGSRAYTTRYVGQYSTVIVNRQGRMVTAWNSRSYNSALYNRRYHNPW